MIAIRYGSAQLLSIPARVGAITMLADAIHPLFSSHADFAGPKTAGDQADTTWAVISAVITGLDGQTVLSKISGARSLRSIPVIVITNSDAKRDNDACYEMGANTCIQKPLNWQIFPEAMNRLKEYGFKIAVPPRTQI